MASKTSPRGENSWGFFPALARGCSKFSQELQGSYQGVAKTVILIPV
jgi:hypothetical protein